jgi:hypothetical protein
VGDEEVSFVMAGVPRNIVEFMKALETYSRRGLNFPKEVEQLVSLVHQENAQIFEDAIFHAKFAVKSQDIMKRIGPQGEGYDKLFSEFHASVEKTTALLKTLVKESPDDVKHHFANTFLGMNEQSFERLTKLLADLSWIKNWQVDGHPLPYEN